MTETLNPSPSLEQNLAPLLLSLRTECQSYQQRYEYIARWFDSHTENLATDSSDLTYLCTLPDEERYFVAYPVIGNYFLEKLRSFQPTNDYQTELVQRISQVILEQRFVNHHLEDFVGKDRQFLFHQQKEEMEMFMLENLEQAFPVYQHFVGISLLLDKEIRNLAEKDNYFIDSGHGILQPVTVYDSNIWDFRTYMEKKRSTVSNISIMVVDDQMPELWYKRFISGGFKKMDTQQGFFYDCESALKALETGDYDVILSDIELGEDKMDGITFASMAYEIQKKKGKLPLISVFSHNQKMLDEAEDQIGYTRYDEKSRLFHQANAFNLKSNFNVLYFRTQVEHAIRDSLKK